MSQEVIEQAVDAYEAGDTDAATNVLLEYYSAENIEARMMYFTATEATRTRRKLIESALEDYRSERYYAAVPLLLMIIDGTFNHATGEGFHTDASLELWDSPMTADGSFETIYGIYRKGRKDIH